MAPGVKVREGYELWRPNREKSAAKTTRFIIALVLLISAALLVVITLGGWERLQSSGVGVMTIGWAALYVLFAFLVVRWVRGVLPVVAAMAIVMIIFAAVAAGPWFARAKDGLESPALPEELLGLLTIIVIPVQLLLIVVAMVGFNQAWNVEEERPIGGRGDLGDGTRAGPDDRVADDEDAPARSSRGPSTRPAFAVADDSDGDWDDGSQRVNPAV